MTYRQLVSLEPTVTTEEAEAGQEGDSHRSQFSVVGCS